MNKTLWTWALGVFAAVAVTVAGNWSSSRTDLLAHRVQALETQTSEQSSTLSDLRLTLARIETKLGDVADRVRRMETKLDNESRPPPHPSAGRTKVK